MSFLEKSIGQAKGRRRALTASRPGHRRSDADGAPSRASGRSDPLARLTKRYTMALQNYLLHPEEVFLQLAYELGRQAVAEGIGLLNLLRIHNAAIGVHAACSGSQPDQLKLEHQQLAAAQTFLMEALSPFEATYRG